LGKLAEVDLGFEVGARIGIVESHFQRDTTFLVKIEQCIKIAKMKEDSLLGKTLKEKVKEVIGTCNSMGVMVEGVSAEECIKLVNQGKFDKPISEEKTELTVEELKEQEEERKKLEEEMKERREEFLEEAQKIIKDMEGKERGEIKAALGKAGIPGPIIDEVLPAEEGAEAKPAAGEKKEGAPAEKKKE